MIIKNLTPYDLHILNNNNSKIITIKSEGTAHAQTTDIQVGEIYGVPIFRKSFQGSENLPPPEKDVLYYCSLMVLQANPNRKDLICANKLLRDSRRNILGVRSFSML